MGLHLNSLKCELFGSLMFYFLSLSIRDNFLKKPLSSQSADLPIALDQQQPNIRKITATQEKLAAILEDPLQLPQ